MNLYKIFSKVLSNLLSFVLPSLIVSDRSAVLKGRAATDNSMIRLELMQKIFKFLSKNLALKLDLMKAFDRVEWNLIFYLMRRMRLLKSYVLLIQNYITTSQIAIHFNQQLTQYFKPSRGLR